MSLIGAYRLILPARNATLTPHLSSLFALGQVNGAQFIKDFNDRTANVHKNVHVRVKLLLRSDRSFTFTVGTPEIIYFLRRIARIKRLGTSTEPPKGNITLREVYHLALVKSMDTRWIGRPLPDICKNIIHQCHSSGVVVTKELLPQFLDRDSVSCQQLFGQAKLVAAKAKAKATPKKKIRKVVKKPPSK